MTNDSPYKENESKSFWNSTIGTITKITALLTAITGLILAVQPFLNSSKQETDSIDHRATTPTTLITGDTNISQTYPSKKYIPTLAEISAFLKAAEIGNIGGLKSELDLGISADITLNDDPSTALVNAVNNNKSEAVKLLLEHGANPDVKIKNGIYPIIEASSGGYTEIVELLIKYKVNVNIRKLDGSGITPLMFACIQGNKSIVQKLIEAGADPNTKSFQNSTALNYANEKASPLKEELIAILNSSGALH